MSGKKKKKKLCQQQHQCQKTCQTQQITTTKDKKNALQIHCHHQQLNHLARYPTRRSLRSTSSPHRNRIFQLKNDLRFLKRNNRQLCTHHWWERSQYNKKSALWPYRRQESTDSSSDIGGSNEEEKHLEWNETSSETGGSDEENEPNTNRHLSDTPDQTRHVVLLTTAQVMGAYRLLL